MKARFVIILLLSFNPNLWAQFENNIGLIYDWEEAKSAHPDTVFAISFAKLRLKELPVELSRFKNLRILNIEKNRLVSLPDFIADFNQLEELNVGRNKLETFPIQVCRMSTIKILILNRNNFESIPACISVLKELNYLDLYDCPIRKIPDSIESLKELKEIDLSGIRFSENFQEYWKKKLPNVKLDFDAPCDCME
jgi:hypothetical protein